MRDYSDRPPIVIDRRHGAARRGVDPVDQVAVDVDEAQAQPVPEGHLERWIAQRVPQPFLEPCTGHAFGLAASDELAGGDGGIRPGSCLTGEHRNRGEEGTRGRGDLRSVECPPAQIADRVCKVGNGDDCVREHDRLHRLATETRGRARVRYKKDGGSEQAGCSYDTDNRVQGVGDPVGDTGDAKAIRRAGVAACVQGAPLGKSVREGEHKRPNGDACESETRNETTTAVGNDTVSWKAEVHVREVDDEHSEHDPAGRVGQLVSRGHQRRQGIKEPRAREE